ncbi:MAG TPA: tetratricopeptide repeat protein [Gemmataceae bacterium]|jgi:serine/threonine protein kinase|nr:tetratricopeptide repeat protein [Gemmataceae bacterium]
MTTDLPTMPSSTEVNALADRLAAEMRLRWHNGEQPLPESYVVAHPELLDHPGAIGELIYEEVSLRRERGETGGSSEVLRRFPRWGSQLRVMLDLRDALDAERRADFPEAGERLGEFHLLGELGRGSRGRVYLARQPALADRPVVVKLTPRTDAEHLSLARLQHTHIVPLYAVHEDPIRRLRILCMPFFGGATLAHALDRLSSTAPAERSSNELWDAIASAPGSNPFGEGRPIPSRWISTDYVRLIVQFGIGLADALEFAHEHDLVHMDVKPSNILLTADGQPMLLDFHLARPPIAASDPPPNWLGGTPAYSAPEQRAALDAVRTARALPTPVDHRADIYSLGAVLFEALAGRLLDGRPLSAHNHAVSVGLSDIIARCLATDPANRYPTAAVLAEDLRRHLAHLPLRGARNRSLAERWRKWRRRRPHALGLTGLLGLVFVVIGLGVSYVRHQRELARTALDEGNAALDRGRFAEARGSFQRGLAVVDGLPFQGDLVTELSNGMRRADRSAVSGDLHGIAERMRALSVAQDISMPDKVNAERLGRQLWDRRIELFALTDSNLPAAVRDSARTDFIDVVLTWSRLRSELTPTDRRAIVDVLTDIEQALGPCAGLYRERAALNRGLGRFAEADADLRRAVATPPSSAWDHVALGTHYLQRGDLEPAHAEFVLAVASDPRSFWARLALGRCDLALGHPEDALLAFAVCVGLDPDNPIGYLHKAHIHARLGQREKALAEVERALALDPNDSQARSLRESLNPAR